MYPSWRYHKTLAPRLIQSPEEEQPGWSGDPAANGRTAFVDQKHPGPMQFTAAPPAEAPVEATADAPKPARARKGRK